MGCDCGCILNYTGVTAIFPLKEAHYNKCLIPSATFSLSRALVIGSFSLVRLPSALSRLARNEGSDG